MHLAIGCATCLSSSHFAGYASGLDRCTTTCCVASFTGVAATTATTPPPSSDEHGRLAQILLGYGLTALSSNTTTPSVR
jgi:hypothetical protein